MLKHGRRPRACPRCGSKELVIVIYGEPSSALLRSTGPYELGGCCVTDASPKWVCRGCGCGIRDDGSTVDWT